MTKLETVSFDGHKYNRGITSTIFTTVKKLIFNDLSHYEEEVATSFPNVESLEVIKFNSLYGVDKILDFLLANLKILKHMKLELKQFDVTRLFQIFAILSNLKTLTAPKDSLSYDNSLPTLKLADKIQTIQESTTFTKSHMTISLGNSVPMEIEENSTGVTENNEITCKSLEDLPFYIFSEIYKNVRTNEIKSLLLVSKRYDLIKKIIDSH